MKKINQVLVDCKILVEQNYPILYLITHIVLVDCKILVEQNTWWLRLVNM